ncbi:MAG TPA: translation initiation factor IF-2 subunit gamma [archaeon]|nr:translation initiation factor IF-2 subunit gamma [archaeon]
MTENVDHGKSTLVQAITGKMPMQHSEELKRGITIKIGYADATIYKCTKCSSLSLTEKCKKDFEKCEAVRTVSFVDAPGHETLMATVISGAALMDGVLFVIAANQECPQTQTREHLKVLDIVGIKNIVIAQTKVDLVAKEQALNNYRQIKEFLKGSVAENAPIVPVSSKQGVNIDKLLEAIEEIIKTPKRDPSLSARLMVLRSFDINRPGTEPEGMNGGILGGSLVQGMLKINDEIEIRPGIRIGSKTVPLKTKVIGIQKAGKDLDEAGPGGLLGIKTTLDPSNTKADSIGGNLAGRELPPVLNSLSAQITLFDKIGEQRIESVKNGELLLLNAGIAKTVGTATGFKKGVVSFDLRIPICIGKGEKIVLSRKYGERWHLIGWGKVL